MAEPVFGKDGFGGNAEHTLKWLNAYYIPYVEEKECEIARFSVGYSLAGLFSLWVYCACNAFSGMVSCSGSNKFLLQSLYQVLKNAPHDSIQGFLAYFPDIHKV